MRDCTNCLTGRYLKVESIKPHAKTYFRVKCEWCAVEGRSHSKKEKAIENWNNHHYGLLGSKPLFIYEQHVSEFLEGNLQPARYEHELV